MMRLIDADSLTYHLTVNDEDEQVFYVKLEDIDDAPSIDPVHAAGGCYCGECGYLGSDVFDDDLFYCDYCGYSIHKDDFCSYGKREKKMEGE